MKFLTLFQTCASASFFQWSVPELLYRYGDETCTFIGNNVHITVRPENSRLQFVSAGCPDETLWLPGDVDQHGLSRTILEFPGQQISCDLTDEQISIVHEYLSRLCLGEQFSER